MIKINFAGDRKVRNHRQGADCAHEAALRRTEVQGRLRLAVLAGQTIKLCQGFFQAHFIN